MLATSNRSKKLQKGVSIIEILIVVAVLGFALVGILGIAVFSLRASTQAKDNLEAAALFQDALEAIRSFKDNIAWNSNDPANYYDGLGVLPTGVNLRLSLSQDAYPKWQIVSGTETIGRFSRRIVFDRVSRNSATKNIEAVYNALNDDPDTREATVFVSWQAKQKSVSAYFTNWDQ